MTKLDRTKRRLRSDPRATISWLDGEYLPLGGYETAEISGIQINLMLEGYEDVYVITVLPGDDSGRYDAWLRRMGSTDVVYMLSRCARDPEDVVVAAMEVVPDYLGIV